MPPCFAFCHDIIASVRWPGDPMLSAYERRHQEQCTAVVCAVGTLVDFMKTPFSKNTPSPFGDRMIPGLMCGYYVHPGGRWSGDYLVAEYSPFQKNPNLTLGQGRKYIHRVKEMKIRYTCEGLVRFPLGERKRVMERLPPSLKVVNQDSIFEPGGAEVTELMDDDGHPALDLTVEPLPEEAPIEPVQEILGGDAGDPVSVPFLENEQPDTRGQAGWTDHGTWNRSWRGSTKPPNIDKQVWTRFDSKCKQEAIAEYLSKIKSGTYVAPKPPEWHTERLKSAGSSVSGASSSGAAPAKLSKRAHSKKEELEKERGEALAEALQLLPLNIVFLEDGPSTAWQDALVDLKRKLKITTNVSIRSYNMVKMTADAVIYELDSPGTVAVLHAAALEVPIAGCRPLVKHYLHECDNLLQHVSKMGGTSMVVTRSDAPYSLHG